MCFAVKRGTNLDEIALKLCDIQGRLFELSANQKYDSIKFIRVFMNSDVSRALDSKYNRMQWAGEEYLLDEVIGNSKIESLVGGEVFSKDVLYWIGYIYRYWHYYSGEDSKKIYKQAPVEVMKRNYMMFHTMDPVLAIEDLKKIYNSDYVITLDELPKW